MKVIKDWNGTVWYLSFYFFPLFFLFLSTLTLRRVQGLIVLACSCSLILLGAYSRVLARLLDVLGFGKEVKGILLHSSGQY